MPRKYLIAALVAASALMIASPTISGGQEQEPITDPTPGTCDQRSATHHMGEAKQIIRKGWALKNWRSGPKKAQERAVQEHIACLERRKDRAKIQEWRHARNSLLRLYRGYRAVTPYKCQDHSQGYWAIPCYIIACESHFSWSAYNPSGARGAYQFLGWPVPWPVNSFRDKVAHHRMAASMSLSNWVCA